MFWDYLVLDKQIVFILLLLFFKMMRDFHFVLSFRSDLLPPPPNPPPQIMSILSNS